MDSDDLGVHIRPIQRGPCFSNKAVKEIGEEKRTFSRPDRQMGIDLNRMHTFAKRFDVILIPSYRENCKQLPRGRNLYFPLRSGSNANGPNVGVYGELLQVSRLISLCMQLFYPIIFPSLFALLRFFSISFLSLIRGVFFFEIMAKGVSIGTPMDNPYG